VSTGNWSYTSFTENRDFLFCSSDRSIQEDLEEIFLADTEKIRPFFSGGLDHRIGLAPESLRPWLQERILSAKKEILVYNQSITDAKFLELLRARAESGIKISLCQNFQEDTSRDLTASFSGLTLLFASKPYLHGKIFLFD
jgi:phosphatidylserine/phosphatidylglycerophosphate/cardiolipin synthase-like enzyme